MHRTSLQLLTNLINDPPSAFVPPRASLPKAINTFQASRSNLKKSLRIALQGSLDAFVAEQRARRVRSTKLQQHIDDAGAQLADNIVWNDQGLKSAIITCVLSKWASEETLRRLRRGEGDGVGYEEELRGIEGRANRSTHPMGDGEDEDKENGGLMMLLEAAQARRAR